MVTPEATENPDAAGAPIAAPPNGVPTPEYAEQLWTASRRDEPAAGAQTAWQVLELAQTYVDQLGNQGRAQMHLWMESLRRAQAAGGEVSLPDDARGAGTGTEFPGTGCAWLGASARRLIGGHAKKMARVRAG